MTRRLAPSSVVDERLGRSLFVAAGGGGDVIAASIFRHKLGRPDDPYVATYSWDRRLIDPAPDLGTRAASTG